MTMYVLAVDDDPDACEVLVEIVEMLGVPVKTAHDGCEAIDQIHDATPDLILLDLMMPRLDGFSVLTRLAGSPITRRIPVIVISACARDQLDMLRLPGVTQVVQKGAFSVEGLSELIRKALRLEESEGAAAGPPSTIHSEESGG